jgi:hypothetical protein
MLPVSLDYSLLLSLRFSLMCIHQTPGNYLCPVLMANYKSRCTILQSFLYIFLINFWTCSRPIYAWNILFAADCIRVMMLSATFNNISAVSWRSVLFVENTGGKHRPDASHWQSLSLNITRCIFDLSRPTNGRQFLNCTPLLRNYATCL